MALNPLQRKSRNSFILGMVVMLIIAGGVIGFIIYQKNELDLQIKNLTSAKMYILNQDVKSGDIIDISMLEEVDTNPLTKPSNCDGITDIISTEYFQDANGERIYGNIYTGMYYSVEVAGQAEPQQIPINKRSDGTYYCVVNENGRNVEKSVMIYSAPVIAKIDITANTPATIPMFAYSDSLLSNDARLHEYNMLKLPSDLNEGEYIDVRLTLPSGQDYIVVAKKQVKKADIDTVWLEVSEDEITTMSNAIIESYIMKGSQLYVTRYVEPGMQSLSVPTYIPSKVVMAAKASNPNLLNDVRKAYADKVDAEKADYNRQTVDAALSQYSEDRKENIEEGVQKSSEKALEARTVYIEGLMPEE